MRVGNKGYEKNTKGWRTVMNHKKLENFVEIVTFFFSENFSFLQLCVNLSDLVVLLVPSKTMTLEFSHMARFSKNWLRWRLRSLCEKESVLIMKKKSKIGNFWNRYFLLLSMVTSESIGLRDFADGNIWDRGLLQKIGFFQKTIFALFCFLLGMARFFQLFLTNEVFFANFCWEQKTHRRI